MFIPQAKLSGNTSSKWLKAYHIVNDLVVDIYLEDDQHVQPVYRYLN